MGFGRRAGRCRCVRDGRPPPVPPSLRAGQGRRGRRAGRTAGTAGKGIHASRRRRWLQGARRAQGSCWTRFCCGKCARPPPGAPSSITHGPARERDRPAARFCAPLARSAAMCTQRSLQRPRLSALPAGAQQHHHSRPRGAQAAAGAYCCRSNLACVRAGGLPCPTTTAAAWCAVVSRRPARGRRREQHAAPGHNHITTAAGALVVTIFFLSSSSPPPAPPPVVLFLCW